MNDWNENVNIVFGVVLGLVLAGTSLAFFGQSKIEFGKPADWFLILATLGIVIVAWRQLKEQTTQQRRWATLQACDRYDIDPRIAGSLRMVRRLKEGEKPALSEYEIGMRITTVFNYFDAIAIGVRQGLYLPEIVKAHLSEIMFLRLEELCASTHPAAQKFRDAFETYYSDLIQVLQEWDPKRFGGLKIAETPPPPTTGST